MNDLTGGYTLVSGERDGRPLPPDHIHDTVVRFTAGARACTRAYTSSGVVCPPPWHTTSNINWRCGVTRQPRSRINVA